MLNGKVGLVVKIVLSVVGAAAGVVSAVVSHNDFKRTDEQIKTLKNLKDSLSK